MQIDVLTIFPEMFEPVLGVSIIQRGREQGHLQIRVHDLRTYTHDKRRTVDDRPYGGGPGMVLKPEPIFEALDALKHLCGHGKANPHCQTLVMSPAGERLTSPVARELAQVEHLIMICGHYEGIDERVFAVVNRAVSIGDYVLTGGELPAMVMIDAVARFIPGVIGHAEATQEESFTNGQLEYPHYTRPPVFRDMTVPEILRSGNHEQIVQWRKGQSVAKTRASRPDLVQP